MTCGNSGSRFQMLCCAMSLCLDMSGSIDCLGKNVKVCAWKVCIPHQMEALSSTLLTQTDSLQGMWQSRDSRVSFQMCWSGGIPEQMLQFAQSRKAALSWTACWRRVLTDRVFCSHFSRETVGPCVARMSLWNLTNVWEGWRTSSRCRVVPFPAWGVDKGRFGNIWQSWLRLIWPWIYPLADCQWGCRWWDALAWRGFACLWPWCGIYSGLFGLNWIMQNSKLASKRSTVATC